MFKKIILFFSLSTISFSSIFALPNKSAVEQPYATRPAIVQQAIKVKKQRSLANYILTGTAIGASIGGLGYAVADKSEVRRQMGIQYDKQDANFKNIWPNKEEFIDFGVKANYVFTPVLYGIFGALGGAVTYVGVSIADSING